MLEFVLLEAQAPAEEETGQSRPVGLVHREGKEPAIEEVISEEHAIEDSAVVVSAAHEGGIWWPFAHRINEVLLVDWERLRRLMIGSLVVGPRRERDPIEDNCLSHLKFEAYRVQVVDQYRQSTLGKVKVSLACKVDFDFLIAHPNHFYYTNCVASFLDSLKEVEAKRGSLVLDADNGHDEGEEPGDGADRESFANSQTLLIPTPEPSLSPDESSDPQSLLRPPEPSPPFSSSSPEPTPSRRRAPQNPHPLAVEQRRRPLAVELRRTQTLFLESGSFLAVELRRTQTPLRPQSRRPLAVAFSSDPRLPDALSPSSSVKPKLSSLNEISSCC
ncbi:uncharacterized protein A4U43_C08F20330 [Asparagus officinalis]|nr:uncharacterized protein A4U43_C08F20330 [Asparagus officinalis]